MMPAFADASTYHQQNMRPKKNHPSKSGFVAAVTTQQPGPLRFSTMLSCLHIRALINPSIRDRSSKKAHAKSTRLSLKQNRGEAGSGKEACDRSGGSVSSLSSKVSDGFSEARASVG